ncbi:hypothetical protein Ahy_B02g061300 [Arachis hypogaea]|uniref:Protein FAR1-RELATED SEQUENCE n=1 Tax=Arachis hypogaea TaxID=3818 RepID=A0A445AKP2_ARAHY|nr:hypothetical protein Ahy_B02g061300 [Arachis hypogaea]
MSHVVWNSLTKEGFGKNWNDFLTKYGVRGNKWLSDLHLWIPVYLDHHFWVGMRSTQRNDIMHAFFNKEQSEREFDAADFHTVIPCAIKSPIEAHFNMCILTRKQVSNSTFNKFVVTYDTISREVKCQCLLFESRDKVAPKYILECWSKNIKRRHTHIKSSQDEPLLEPRSKRFDDLVFQFHNICKFASKFEKLTGILYRTFDNVMAEMQEYQAKSKGKNSLSHEDSTLSNVNDHQTPPRVRTRGCSKNILGSNIEKKSQMQQQKKKKKPALSELNLLDGGLMIQSSSSFYYA